jgi:hypothetical protein
MLTCHVDLKAHDVPARMEREASEEMPLLDEHCPREQTEETERSKSREAQRIFTKVTEIEFVRQDEHG